MILVKDALAIFTSFIMNKGYKFNTIKNTYVVKNRTKKGITVEKNETEKIFIKLKHGLAFGSSKVDLFYDDLEGTLLIDNLNAHNPLHNLSTIYTDTLNYNEQFKK